MPPRINDRIYQTVSETQNRQRTRDDNPEILTFFSVDIFALINVDDRRYEKREPSHDEAPRRKQHHFNSFPFVGRLDACRGFLLEDFREEALFGCFV